MTTKSTRGLKVCPRCKTSVGVRTIACECGHKWEIKKKKDAPSAEPVLVIKRTTRTTVIAPAGECPIAFKGEINKENIREWAENLIFYGQKIGQKYELPAVKYWIRHFLPMHVQGKQGYDEKYQEAVGILQSVFRINQEEVEYVSKEHLDNIVL